MPDYDNNMRGVLFKNDRGRGENSPPYTGSCEIEGEEYWVSAWVNEGKKGKYFKLSFKAKDGRLAKAKENPKFDEDLDIPF